MKMMIRQPRGGRTAFTLVELLTVIAVIAILLAILLPTISKSRASSYLVMCKSNLRQIGIATRMYANDFRDRYPDSYTLGGAFYRRGIGERNPDDPGSLPERYGLAAVYGARRYLPATGKLWICPSASELFQSYKNTYVHALGFPGTSGRRGKVRNENVFWVWDNFQNFPYTTGKRRGPGDPNPPPLPFDRAMFAHQYKMKSKYGASNILFVDGHVGMAIYIPGSPLQTIIIRGE